VQGASAQEKGKAGPLEQILADWKHRQGLLKTVRYVVSGTTEYKETELPPGNPIRPKRTVLLLDLEGKRYRLESSEEVGRAGREFIPRVNTIAFNGKIGQGYLHRDINQLGDDGPDLVIGKSSAHGTWFDPHLWPVLYAHGLVPTVHTHVRLDKMPPSYDADDFEVRGRQTYRGRNYMVVRTHPMAGNPPIHDELWVDLSQRSAIHRHVSFNGTNPWNVHDVEWKQTAFGWWPDQWTLTWTLNGKLQRIYRLKVESFEVNPSVFDGDFTLAAKPGMKVLVSENPPPDSGLNPYLQASKTYLVLPSGGWQEIDAKGFTTTAGKQLSPKAGQAWIWWTIGASVLAVGIVGFLFRRRHKETPHGPSREDAV
jgi:hypothetical protein